MGYYLLVSAQRVDLPRTLQPSEFAPIKTGHNLVRARGYRTVYDLSDGLPDPEPLVLTGYVQAAHEDALSSVLTELRRYIRLATAVGRTSSQVPGQSRWEMQLLSSSMVAAPVNGDARDALVTLTLVLREVPDVDGLGAYW